MLYGNSDEMAEDLLLRETIDLCFTIDASAARGMSDETLERLLGRIAREKLRELQSDNDSS